MGQYYTAVILKDDGKTIRWWADSQGFVKLTEHSWIVNSFVTMIEKILADNPLRIVWAGDYADKCKGMNSNLHDRCGYKINKNKEILYSYSDKEIKTQNLVFSCPDDIKKYRYIVNHTTKQFVDKKKCPISSHGKSYRMHPLPILTCEGNGRGGGDYRYRNKEDEKLVGSWARHLISVCKYKPNKQYVELEVNFKE